jgi:hypothetical protein
LLVQPFFLQAQPFQFSTRTLNRLPFLRDHAFDSFAGLPLGCGNRARPNGATAARRGASIPLLQLANSRFCRAYRYVERC